LIASPTVGRSVSWSSFISAMLPIICISMVTSITAKNVPIMPSSIFEARAGSVIAAPWKSENR